MLSKSVIKTLNNFRFYVEFVLVVILGILEVILYKYFGNRRKSSVDESDIYGKVTIVTGASRGLGKATAFEFAKRGAIVVLGCVDIKEGEDAANEIRNKTGNQNVFMIFLDLSDMTSVEKFAKIINSMYPKISIIINNAGISAPESPDQIITKDGFNLQMAVNHLGHFLLTNLLIENLKRGSPSRVVCISSLLQLNAKLDLNDFMMTSGYGPSNHLPYSNSKFSNSLFVKELSRRLQGTGVTTYALCPSFVRTEIFQGASIQARMFFQPIVQLFGFSPEEAASEFILHCAIGNSVAKESGITYRFKRHFHHANYFLTDKLAQDVWMASEKILDFDKRFLRFNESIKYTDVNDNDFCE